MKKNKLFAILMISGLCFAFVSFANPTSTPPGGNKSAPIHSLAAGQSKVGTLYNGELVNRAFGFNTTPIANETVAVSGGVVIGSISGSDSFTIFSNGTELGNTTICQKTHTYTNPSSGTCGGSSASNSADGVVNISSLSGASTRPICIQQVTISGVSYNKVVLCP